MAGDRVALFVAGIDSHAGTLGPAHVDEPAGRWQETCARVLRVYASLNGMLPTVPPGFEVEMLAERDAQLLLDEVEAKDELGHRMFDLEAGVHLEEVEVAVLIDDEFHRPGTAVAGLAGDRHG